MLPSPRNMKCLFIGAGQMATALIGGFIQSGILLADQITACDPNPDRRAAVSERYSVQVSDSFEKYSSDLIFICVKPSVVPNVIGSIKLESNPLIVSIAAGITISSIQTGFGTMDHGAEAVRPARIIRVMPNTPCLVQEAASGISAGPYATQTDVDLILRLMSSVGKAIVVPESKLDAVTGLSGSGPAYVFTMIEALADGGVATGLNRDQAQLLAAQTVLGAAKMVLETGIHPGQLKDSVASPAGTTIAGLIELERKGYRAALINAVLAATDRSHCLSKQ